MRATKEKGRAYFSVKFMGKFTPQGGFSRLFKKMPPKQAIGEGWKIKCGPGETGKAILGYEVNYLIFNHAFFMK
ncbi:hypothetical protein GCM10011405_09900 [Rufibacter glacialis]|nr:hypothetical protein GCM10011405_09900 [Rufibacter glacialis]